MSCFLLFEASACCLLCEASGCLKVQVGALYGKGLENAAFWASCGASLVTSFPDLGSEWWERHQKGASNGEQRIGKR